MSTTRRLLAVGLSLLLVTALGATALGAMDTLADDASDSADLAGVSEDGVDPDLFFDGALAGDVSTEDCTLSGGTETTCYRITVAGYPVSYETGPFCPATITDDTGGLWWDGEAVYDLTGEFIASLAEVYDDDNWQMYDEDGNVFVTETAEEFEAAARPDVDPSLQNHCVEGRLEWLEDGEPVPTTVLIPTVPVAAESAAAPQGNQGVTLDGVVIANSAPVDAILGAYTIAAFDDCGAHFNPFDGYHLHGAVGCSELEGDAAEGETAMFGYAMDGYPIHSPLEDESNLDACNGHIIDGGYHYHANAAAENQVVECLVGQTVASADGGPGGGPPDGGPPADDPADDPATDNVARSIDWSAITNADASTDETVTVLLARDDDFADSLASGGAQSLLDATLLLTGGDELDARVAAELERLGTTDVVLLGGEAALSAAVENDLTDRGYATSRLDGASRLETATAIAASLGPDATQVVIARAFAAETGTATQAVADALAGASLSARLGVPLLLTETDMLSTATAAHLADSVVTEAFVLGGTAAISEQVVTDLEALGITVTRLAGDERAGTAVAIAVDGLGLADATAVDGVVLIDGDDADSWADAFPAARLSMTSAQATLLSAGDALPGATSDYLVPSDAELRCGSTTANAACVEAAARLSTGSELAAFDEGALTADPVTVSCTLENGSETTCYQLEVSSLPDTVATDGPYCPPTVDDQGGIWVWDGDDPGLYDLDAAFWAMMEAQGFDFVDADGNVTITDPGAGGADAGGTANSCLEATPDGSFHIQVLLPTSPELLAEPTDLSTISQVGIALDGVTIFGDAPSVADRGGLPALDACGGHIDPSGYFHWHFGAESIQANLDAAGTGVTCDVTQDEGSLVAYAFDGYAIYGPEEDGAVPTDLDDCSGHVADTEKFGEVYHYHLTTDSPNLPACRVGATAVGTLSSPDNPDASLPSGDGPGAGGPPEGGPGGVRPGGPPQQG